MREASVLGEEPNDLEVRVDFLFDLAIELEKILLVFILEIRKRI